MELKKLVIAFCLLTSPLFALDFGDIPADTNVTTLWVAPARTLTIGGVTFDLSANRTWTAGTILDSISSTQGVILYRGASNWAALATGTDGKVLTTHGAAANPTWETLTSQISDTAYNSTTWDGVTTIGASKNALRDYFVLFDTDGDGKVNVLDQGAGIPVTDSSGVLQTPPLAPVQGRIIYADDTGWTTLPTGTDGKVLTTHGASANPTWETSTGAPSDADYLVGTSNGGLSAEIVVGTTPGGELGGTWGSPTIDDSVTVATWTMTGAPGLTVNNGATSAGSIGFKEDSDNGSNSVTLIGPSSTADVTVTLPAATDTLVGKDTTDTLTNKRINPRVTIISSNATWSPNADTDDIYEITAQAADATTISNPSGTPVNGQKLIIKVTGTAARALTWSGSQWRASSDLALPTTTTTTKTMYLGFVYNTTGPKWDLVAKLDNF